MDINYKIKWFDTLDSTNSEALRNLDASSDMDVYAALFQSAGRGQRGNKWESGSGMNMTFSIVFKPDHILASEQFIISRIASLGVVEYLARRRVDAKIKWPNDIYVNERKICGMLIENSILSDKVSASIAGIGVNINQRLFHSDAPNPTSLILERGGEELNVKEELDLLVKIIFDLYRATIDGTTDLKQEYHNRLYRLGIKSRFFDVAEDAEFDGTIIGLDDVACLVVEREDGAIKNYAFKEVRIII